jgi:hypothetical protein
MIPKLIVSTVIGCTIATLRGMALPQCGHILIWVAKITLLGMKRVEPL